MSCARCNEMDEEKRFPANGKQYTCTICNQRWWCYNECHRLWTTVDDDFTWDVITHNVDFPINITNPAVVMPGYEKYAVKPVHKICQDRIPYPSLKIMDGPGGEPTAAIQFTGNWKSGNIFKHQFLFPLEGRMPDADWMRMEMLCTFHIPFVGTISDWPYEVSPEAFSDSSDTRSFAFLISDRLKLNENQVSFIIPLVFLGDPNVGVIRPQRFFDDYFREFAVEKFQKL